jgi:signal transduction histidine kinase
MIYSAQLAGSDIDKTSQTAKDIERIVETGIRGSDLLRQHFAYINPGKTGHDRLDIDRFTEAKIDKINRSVSNKKMLLQNPVVFTSSGPKMFCDADPLQLEIILEELISNAVTATQNIRSKISVTVCPADNTFKNIFRIYKPKDYITISVSDNGCGIPEEIISDIFDPLFTTGDPKKVTGTGLTIVYGLVSNHGGELAVISTPGMTLFNIYLPKS